MKEFEFYDPHPGFAGAAVKLPESMKKAAEELAGKNLSLEEAIRKLQPIAEELKGRVTAIEEHNYLGFLMKRGDTTHYYCLIRYR